MTSGSLRAGVRVTRRQADARMWASACVLQIPRAAPKPVSFFPRPRPERAGKEIDDYESVPAKGVQLSFPEVFSLPQARTI
ncbi:hypothetical protein GCM10011579_054030 [Streptomyces albiflavescens]|uniref:Uncharacterized protein n=1 Tax=Streptomyces albiflavescens TaxID=1623582 RepID=A0A917Y7A8_9ACTN|nr:hypothetical protein GCM10011579_054030 [Streptomyces albiflavescens]